MAMLLISFVIIVAAMLVMAIGVMSGRSRIRGSCGGLGQGKEAGCSICGGSCEDGDRQTVADSPGLTARHDPTIHLPR